MTAVYPEGRVEEEFADLDELEVIDSSELKVGGAYHAYAYIYAEDIYDVAD
ncbi:hypothetical protein [Streptomyces sp. NPDC003032]